MDRSDSNKRLKSSTGRPISTSSAGAANLPAYQPPPQIIGGARGSSGSGSTRPSASIARPANGATSLRLTVKAPPSKLRQATSGSQLGNIPPNPYANDHSESDDTPAPRAARATRNPRTVIEPESDEDEDDDEDAEGEELDEEDVDGMLDSQLLANEDSEEDAEGEEDDMDDVQQDHPPPPVIKQQRGTASIRSNITVAPPPSKALKSVEAKEMEDDDDDEELSELDSNDEQEDENDENDEEDEESGSDEDDENSRSATPDLTKLTKRQRAAFEEDPALMALSNEAQKKKHLTDEEHVQRRAEMARRRKNLSEKRNEEEKMETINKLLQKQAPKRRTRAEIAAANAAEHSGEEDEEGRPKPNLLYVRWVNNKDGSRIGVPEEWLHAPIGDVFKRPGGGGRMIEEVA